MMSSASKFESSKVEEVSTIESHMVPEKARVVFDWDNTLKVINRREKKIESRVSPEFLSHLIEEKKCDLFIISAIRPSRMNMDTLLMEVDRLGLRKYFCDATTTSDKKLDPQRNHGNFPWMHEGNIIICGYDKAEAFLTFINTGNDQVDGFKDERPTVFFDDEDVNIENFSMIVKGSHCYKVTSV